jgi:2-C-methyl-D-erythritol 2,4-cyclodiphosphate synthase
VREAGWSLANVDSTVVAQAPKLAPHIEADALAHRRGAGIAPAQVNVKAKTAEKLGPVGMGQSIEARAVVC